MAVRPRRGGYPHAPVGGRGAAFVTTPTGECGSANDIKGQIQKNQGEPFYKLHVAPATPNPDGAFVAQQTRNLYMSEEPSPFRYPIRDRDSTFIRLFDEVFTSEGARVVKTPVRAPEANAFAERFVRTVATRSSTSRWCLTEETLTGAFAATHSTTTSNDLIALSSLQRGTVPQIARSPGVPRVGRVDVLGGLIHEYEPAAESWIRGNVPFTRTRPGDERTGGSSALRRRPGRAPREHPCFHATVTEFVRGERWQEARK